MKAQGRPMRIALLTDSDAFAGTERHIHDLDVSLRALGVDVRVCCPSGTPLARHVKASGGMVAPVERGRGPDVPAIRLMAKRLAAGEIDLIHAHNGRSALIAAGAKRLARTGRVVLTQHFLAPAYTGRGGLAGRASRAIHHWVDRQIDNTIAISDAVRDAAVARGEATAGSITTVHNGIREPAPRADPQMVRASLGLNPDSLLMVCAARLAAEKRIDVLIESMRSVITHIPQLTCVVAGTGDAMAKLQAQIADAGLGDRVRLLGFRDDVIDLVNACDLFVLPSDAEPFGLALVEAMALGKCVIATDAGGPREIVEPGVCGLLARPADASSLAEQIVRAAGDASSRARYGAAAAARFRSHFRCERMAQAIASLYARTLGVSVPASTSREPLTPLAV